MLIGIEIFDVLVDSFLKGNYTEFHNNEYDYHELHECRIIIERKLDREFPNSLGGVPLVLNTVLEQLKQHKDFNLATGILKQIGESND